jgi:hypothetical protein
VPNKLADCPPPDPPVEGWYPDPTGMYAERKWNGKKWTQYSRGGSAPAEPVPPPEPFDGPTWEYHFENLVMHSRWTVKKQIEESERFNLRLNALGSQGWELVSYGPIGVHGTMTGSQKNTAYIGIFKRPLPAQNSKD